VRCGRKKSRGCIQRIEANAARIPGDNIVGSLEKCADIPPDLTNEIDSRAARSTCGRMLGEIT